MPITPLLGLSLDELLQVSARLDLPRRTATQLAKWIYQRHVADISLCTDLAKDTREILSREYEIGCHEPVKRVSSSDGTVKYLFPTATGFFVETVFIPSEEGRGTVCISSQVGCKMGCIFCMTGRQGFQANLSAADILNQLHSLPERDKVTNIVFMGQGEPMDNVDNVLRAIRSLTASWGHAMSARRVTVSTVGLRQGLVRLLDDCECHVAISLHHPTHMGRMALMPAERAMPLDNIVKMLKQYDFCNHKSQRSRPDDKRPIHFSKLSPRQRRLSFEYILFAGVNDSEREADQLVNLLRGLDCRVNLIPFHAIPNAPLKGTPQARMLQFRDYLTNHGVFATLRVSRGQDIEAACGLLHTGDPLSAMLPQENPLS